MGIQTGVPANRVLSAQEFSRPVQAVLNSYASLNQDDLDLVESALIEPRSHQSGGIVSEAEPRFVVSGWVAQVVQFADGRRQIVSLFLPGEPIERAPPSSVEVLSLALSPALTVSGRKLQELVGHCEGHIRAAWEALHGASAIYRLNQMLRLGRMTAHERAASLFIELHERQRRADLASDDHLQLPLTQEMLADVLGLSVIHTNRVLQRLRSERLIHYGGGRVELLDREELSSLAMVRG